MQELPLSAFFSGPIGQIAIAGDEFSTIAVISLARAWTSFAPVAGSSVRGGLSNFWEVLGLVRIASTFCTREAWHLKTCSNLTVPGRTV